MALKKGHADHVFKPSRGPFYDLPPFFWAKFWQIMCLNQVCFFLQNGGGRQIMCLNHPWPIFWGFWAFLAKTWFKHMICQNLAQNAYFCRMGGVGRSYV